MPGPNPFDPDAFMDALGRAGDILHGRETAPKVPAPPVRARTIDGVRYVRADDMAAVLEAHGITGPIIDKLRRKV
jgi:hypothetical protein